MFCVAKYKSLRACLMKSNTPRNTPRNTPHQERWGAGVEIRMLHHYYRWTAFIIIIGEPIIMMKAQTLFVKLIRYVFVYLMMRSVMYTSCVSRDRGLCFCGSRPQPPTSPDKQCYVLELCLSWPCVVYETHNTRHKTNTISTPYAEQYKTKPDKQKTQTSMHSDTYARSRDAQRERVRDAQQRESGMHSRGKAQSAQKRALCCASRSLL